MRDLLPAYFCTLLLFVLLASTAGQAQNLADSLRTARRDSIYIAETEATGLDKVLHAEPLYIDLIRDLGARKGEQEWNVGLGLTDNNNFDAHTVLVEYEWAPVNRLGLEVEVPFTFYSGRPNVTERRPDHQLNGLKTAIQYSFFVSEKLKTSLAVGYINEIVMNDLRRLSSRLVTGNQYSPFFVAAKRWGSSFHSLIYTGPVIEQHYATGHVSWTYEHNTSFHYMIPGTRNFLGVEVNQAWYQGPTSTIVIRPQMRVSVADNLLIGIVGGIPLRRENERLSSFLRLIYEPGHRGPR